MTVARETLYDEVWAEPMTVVAARYDVSANFLARVCHTLNVPHPPRGYWAKLKVGKAAPRPAPPAATAGHATGWTRGVTPVARTIGAVKRLPGSDETPRPRGRPARHPLVDGVSGLFQRGRTSDSGYLRPCSPPRRTDRGEPQALDGWNVGRWARIPLLGCVSLWYRKTMSPPSLEGGTTGSSSRASRKPMKGGSSDLRHDDWPPQRHRSRVEFLRPSDKWPSSGFDGLRFSTTRVVLRNFRREA